MLVYAVDLGTTNTKVVLYDGQLNRLHVASTPAVYRRSGAQVEFDPVALFDAVVDLIGECSRACPDRGRHDALIAVSGQAESIVLVDEAGAPVRPGISWLDDRAVRQAEEITAEFAVDDAFAVTGQPEATATWPAAKLRWLSQMEPESLDAARAVLMIKDDLVRRFTGRSLGETTTRGFSYFYDVLHGRYWDDMLRFCGVDPSVLPELVPAAADAGAVLPAVEARLPSARSYRVNVAALDHFCSMVGTGSYAEGVVSESSGTVLSLSMLAGDDWRFDPARRVSFHRGLADEDVVLFSGADSGGVVLDWFRREGLGDLSYAELETSLQRRASVSAPIFLPYLTGLNPPDFLSRARGAFVGIELQHDRFDLAFAVEEGVAHLLKRNVDYLSPYDRVRSITSTGGGAASVHWSQLKADVCDLEVVVPAEQEATCRGAAVLALVTAGELGGIADAGSLNEPAVTTYIPSTDEARADRYRQFVDALTRLYAS